MSDEPISDAPEQHDFSRLDAHLAATRRTALLHASWRPALAGAAGAALVIAVVYVALPKFTVREVTVDHVNVVPKGVAVDHIIPHGITVYHIITHEVTINNPVPHDVPFNVPVPRIVQPPMPPIASAPSDAPTTPEEKRFVGSPEYQSAIYRGRIVSTDGRAISFADGKELPPRALGRFANRRRPRSRLRHRSLRGRSRHVCAGCQQVVGVQGHAQ